MLINIIIVRFNLLQIAHSQLYSHESMSDVGLSPVVYLSQGRIERLCFGTTISTQTRRFNFVVKTMPCLG